MKRQHYHMLSSTDQRKRHHGLEVTFCGPGVKVQRKKELQKGVLEFGVLYSSAVDSV